MQARLPDINTAFIVYRREAISSWKSRTYDSCFGSLNTLNGLLPKKYRVVISTKEYDNKTKQDLIACCTKCDAEIDFRSVQVFELIAPFTQSVINGNVKEKVWNCTECKKINHLDDTKIIQKVLQEPYFLQVVPKPPIRREGMMDRTRYHIKFSIWFWTVLGEIEQQMAQFRDDNWHKEGELYDIDTDIGDSGEADDA